MKIRDIVLSEEFELNKKEPSKVFEFYSTDFKLNIISAKLKVNSDIDWQSLLSKLEVEVHVFGQDLEYLSHIHLFNDNVNYQPCIQLNKLIDKQVFKSGTQLGSISNIMVKIELVEKERIYEPFALFIEVKN